MVGRIFYERHRRALGFHPLSVSVIKILLKKYPDTKNLKNPRMKCMYIVCMYVYLLYFFQIHTVVRWNWPPGCALVWIPSGSDDRILDDSGIHQTCGDAVLCLLPLDEFSTFQHRYVKKKYFYRHWFFPVFHIGCSLFVFYFDRKNDGYYNNFMRVMEFFIIFIYYEVRILVRPRRFIFFF